MYFMAEQASDTQKYWSGKSSSIFYDPKIKRLFSLIVSIHKMQKSPDSKSKSVSEIIVTSHIKLEYPRSLETSIWLDRLHTQSDGECLTLILPLNLKESRFWWIKIPTL